MSSASKKRTRDSSPLPSPAVDDSSSPQKLLDGAFFWGGKWQDPVGSAAGSKQRKNRLPAVGDVVTCRVLRINPRLASVEILCVGDDALPDPCSGLIRREDVRPIDASAPVEVYRSFRPGDIVLARVLSLGDARAYYLSTSEVALGVVLARSSEGAVLRPVSHCLMECPKTKNREPRKVAKPAAPPPAEPETAAAEPAEA